MKLIIGDKTEYLSEYAKSIDSGAYLIKNSNFKNTHTGVAYTSLADLDLNHFLHVIAILADDVEYYPPKIWSSEELKIRTERELTKVSQWQKIKGSEQIEKCEELTLSLVDDRKTNRKQLWCAGGSITFGVGVDKDQSWPELVSQKLGLKLSLLSSPASSIRWVSDQILRSDIRKDDLVIWGLTSSARFPCYQSGYTIHAAGADAFKNEKIKQYYNLDLMLDHDVLVNESIIAIQSVSNFCKKIGAKLILAEQLDSELFPYINDIKKYVCLNLPLGEYLDLDYNGTHPGPKQHEEYAKRIVEWIHTQY
jgi:hypothetical protein